MSTDSKLAHGTPPWFDMVGALMMDAALHAGLGPEVDCSLVERYVDGAAVGSGLVQGLRFEIAGGVPSFRRGVGPHERADLNTGVTIEVTAGASRRLNTMSGADPAFPALLAHLQATGELKVEGDLNRLGAWFGAVHDRIVARTC